MTTIVPNIDSGLTVQDKLRLHLESYGQREIPVTVQDLANRIGLPRNSVYQGLHRLERYNEVQLDKIESNGRDKIVGVKLLRLQPSGRTYRRAAERSNSRVQRFRPVMTIPSSDPAEAITDEIPALPSLIDYLEKKLAVEEIKEKALSAGLDESIIQFEPNDLAEEGIILLKLYTEIKKRYEELKSDYQRQGFDLDAERRNVEFLKNKVKEETREELLAFNAE